ncbi:head-tail adaptor protein [Pseudomonas sp. 770NI]|uniref:phage head closure protein n=1 Tax=Pseudomonas sp. 770NI TaxID=2528664 RepID=UPI001023D6AB|nr:phage head closure protein [Pseudomonas sp. 770NI]RZI28275.1 head-tail adaptor protein [Pseudomonas sp. 770NI]
MRAGDLRHRITLQSPEYTQDDITGEMTPSWVEVAKIWASVEPVSVNQFVSAATNQSKVSARIVIRYRKGIDPTMRILHRDKIYNIEGVLADKVSGLEYLTLPCSEGVNDG